MQTTLTESPSEAASFVREGQLTAFPTETVYGLGADAFSPGAVRAIFEAKGRPSDNPLIVHVGHSECIEACVDEIPDVAKTLTSHFWPGPLTVILSKSSAVPDVVTAGLCTVGIRFPSHPVAQKFLRACETPIAAPSANRSGRPSPTTWAAVEQDLGGRIACILKGDRTEEGLESTVVDCTTSPPVVLRPGAISVEALKSTVGAIRVETDGQETDEAVRSPGTRHRHYAPAARVHLVTHPDDVTDPDQAGYIGLDRPEDPSQFLEVSVASTVDAYAHELFHFFRVCDERDCSVIYAQTVPEAGVGRALNDRLRRAAAV